MSPWLAFRGSKKNEGVPVDDNVAAHFLAIIPLFPTPDIITFPCLQFKISFTTLYKERLILFFKLFNALIGELFLE